MKKVLLLLLILMIVAGGYIAWIFLGPATAFTQNSKFLYIKSDSANKASILSTLQREKFIKHPNYFEWLAGRMNYWQSIKAGKYEIKKNESILSIVRQLRNGRQTPVDLTIIKLRTKSDLAKLTARKLGFDSTSMMAFLNNADSLKKYGLTPETVMTAILPDTYTYFWNTTPQKVFKKIIAASEKFWTDERKQKASQHGLTEQQVYILASIIEEETNAKSDKPNIASVYLNRMEKGMPLQADPTVKFALQDFGLKRIYQKHLSIASPYNTYRNKGLPPGPVSTPSKATIDSVLNSPKTDYLYFVANSDFSGSHIFTTNYNDHLKYARDYQQALNKQDSIRKAKQAEK
jgi:UPF0755 protein